MRAIHSYFRKDNVCHTHVLLDRMMTCHNAKRKPRKSNIRYFRFALLVNKKTKYNDIDLRNALLNETNDQAATGKQTFHIHRCYASVKYQLSGPSVNTV